MPTTQPAAYDEINGIARAAWAASAQAIAVTFNAGWTSPPIIYEWTSPDQRTTDGKPEGPDDKPFARVFVLHTSGRQTSLTGPTNRALHTNYGTVIIEVLAPWPPANGPAAAQALANMLGLAYKRRRTPNGVWFKAVSVQEKGRNGPWYKCIVTARFEWDELVATPA